jgi:YVTN family beta-propeller protein
MRPLAILFFAIALASLPALSHAGAEEDALKAIDDTNAHVMALSAVRSPSVQNFQTAQGEVTSLQPFFENLANTLTKVPLDSTTRLIQVSGNIEGKLETAGKVTTVNVAVFIDTCRSLMGDLDQWQAMLPDVRRALQQQVDAKTQGMVRDEVAKTFSNPLPSPAGSGPSAFAGLPTSTPMAYVPVVQPTPTMVPDMLATPVPASVVDGGVLPGGWTQAPNPPAPVFTPMAGGSGQTAPRLAQKLPVAIVAGHNNQRVWVANVHAGSVGVMEAGSQRFSAEIPVGSQPQALALDDSDSNLVVANYASNNVSIVDARKDSVLKTQTVGAGPIQVLITHNQKAYVLCQEGKTVAVIDLKLRLLLRSIVLSSRPGRMDMADSNQKIYVTLPDEDSVAVIDTSYDDVAAVVKEQ